MLIRLVDKFRFYPFTFPMIEITAFATAVSHAFDIAKTIMEARDAAKIRELKLEFTTALMDVTQKQLALTQAYQTTLDSNEALNKQIAAYERWEQESQRYKLHQLEPGILVYALKPEHAPTQPTYWLCAACYHQGKKSMLQRASKGSETWTCPCDQNHAITTAEYC